jgi:hypothetical protein
LFEGPLLSLTFAKVIRNFVADPLFDKQVYARGWQNSALRGFVFGEDFLLDEIVFSKF